MALVVAVTPSQMLWTVTIATSRAAMTAKTTASNTAVAIQPTARHKLGRKLLFHHDRPEQLQCSLSQSQRFSHSYSSHGEEHCRTGRSKISYRCSVGLSCADSEGVHWGLWSVWKHLYSSHISTLVKNAQKQLYFLKKQFWLNLTGGAGTESIVTGNITASFIYFTSVHVRS